MAEQQRRARQSRGARRSKAWSSIGQVSYLKASSRSYDLDEFALNAVGPGPCPSQTKPLTSNIWPWAGTNLNPSLTAVCYPYLSWSNSLGSLGQLLAFTSKAPRHPGSSLQNIPWFEKACRIHHGLTKRLSPCCKTSTKWKLRVRISLDPCRLDQKQKITTCLILRLVSKQRQVLTNASSCCYQFCQSKHMHE